MGYFEDGVYQPDPREAMEEPASYPGEEPLEVTVSKLSKQEIEDFWTPKPPRNIKDIEEMFDWYVAQEKEKGGMFSSASKIS